MILRFLMFLYFLSIPFTAALGFSSWVPLYMASLGIYLFVFTIQTVGQVRIEVKMRDIVLFCAIILGFVGMLFAPDLGRKNVGHVSAIVTCTVLFYLAVRDNLVKYLDLYTIVKWLSVVLCIAAGFIITEFIFANFLHITLSNYIPYTIQDEAELGESTMLGIWVRPRGFAIEAGHMATFFELALPISWIYMRAKSIPAKLIYYVICISSFLLLSSAAAIISIIIAIILSFTFSRFSIGKKISVLFGICVLLIGIYLSPMGNTIDSLVLSKVLGYSGLVEMQDTSSQDRSYRHNVAIEISQNYPAGIGWGTAAHMYVTHQPIFGKDAPFGFVSFYAELIVAGGVLSLILFFVFVGIHFRDLLLMHTSEAPLLFISLASLVIHYATISNYWFPAFWLIFVIIQRFRAEQGRLQHEHP